jgi:hypothetical protein
LIARQGADLEESLSDVTYYSKEMDNEYTEAVERYENLKRMLIQIEQAERVSNKTAIPR